jgi:ribosomal protein L11 methyltransferase
VSYTALTFDAAGIDADRWSDALIDAGALSVDVSDSAAGTPHEQAVYAEPNADAAAWARARIVALVADGVDADALLLQAAASIDCAVPAFAKAAVAEADWVRATQAQFGPIAIGDRLHVVPTWCEPPAGGVTVRLDPGLAFGTGSHPTTRLCLEWLLGNVRAQDSVLDYGCGSGILAIAAAKLGAARVVGIDLDAQALRASRDNAARNGVSAAFVPPDALGSETFDVVVANILANPLVLLAPAIAARVVPGGRIALSGVLAPQAGDVIASYAQWFTLGAARADGDWVLVEGMRKSRVD